MKELTIEEKAKRYDEVLERTRYWEKNPTVWSSDDICQKLFPELQESEDEKVRKEIVTYLKSVIYRDVIIESWIAWLEKQVQKPQGKSALEASKEEKVDNANKIEPKDHSGIDPHFWKPIDKIEPKFHEGEWVTNGDYTWKIVEVKPLDYIFQSQDGNIVDDTIYHVDEQFHSFTIEDAKDGDVLFMDNGSANCIFIYKSSNNGIINKYASYNKFGFEGEHYLVLNDGYVIPATKEQRGLLFQKMHEAGYEWDTEKKELILFRVNKCC